MPLTAALLLTEGYWKHGGHIAGFVITVFFTVVPGIALSLYLRKKQRCTAEVEAVVEDIDVREDSDSDGGISITYAPVYGFYFGGQMHRVTSGIYTGKRPYEIGEHVTVCVDPENPEKLFDAKRERKTAVFISAIAAAFIVFGIIAMLN